MFGIAHQVQSPFVFILALLLFTCDGLELRALDVGQGDAILLRDKSETALVDTGPSDNIVARLRALGVSRLSVLVATHNHDDHIGGVDAVLRAMAVAEFVDNGFPAATAIHRRVVALLETTSTKRATPATRASVKLGATTLRFLPLRPFSGGRPAKQ